MRALYLRYAQHSRTDPERAHAMYHPDAVLEFPQSGERFEGVENMRGWRQDYPAEVAFDLRRVRGREDFWVVEVRASYDGGPWAYGIAVVEFRGELVARETIYYGEAWEPPGWRARWRAAPPPPAAR